MIYGDEIPDDETVYGKEVIDDGSFLVFFLGQREVAMRMDIKALSLTVAIVWGGNILLIGLANLI